MFYRTIIHVHSVPFYVDTMRFFIWFFFAVASPFMLSDAQTPPPPQFFGSHLPPLPPPPPPPSSQSSISGKSISIKCSRFLNVDDQVKIMTMGRPLTMFFIPMITSCDDIVCTKIYNASCSPQRCPKCKVYAGSAKNFQAQVEDAMGNNLGVSCSVEQIYTVYGITCTGKNNLANVTSKYALRIYFRQMNGTLSRLDDMAVVALKAGDVSIVDSGPGFWPDGNDLAIGIIQAFIFPVKDKYGNVKRRSSGAATGAELSQFNLMFSSNVDSVRLKYDAETGYVNVTFIPTKLGVSELSIGRIGNGNILGSPYIFKVAISGPISSENCLAVWSSGQNIMMAGNLGYVTIYLRDSYNNTVDILTGWSDTKDFSLSLIDKVGNKCQNCTTLTAVPGSGYETAIINVTMPGYYKLNISDGDIIISGSPINFTVIAGTISVKNCIASWLNDVSSIRAGDVAVLRVLLMDAYSNNISVASGRKVLYRFNVFSNNTLNMVNYANFNMSLDTIPGYERISFIPTTVGQFLLHVSYGGEEVFGSPYNFTVTPGTVSIAQCQGFWLNNISKFTAGERATLQVFMLDKYNNDITSASEIMNFSASVLDMNEHIVFLNLQQIYYGNCSCQLISFDTSISGDFLLQIGKGKMFIYASPFFFHVDPGEIHLSSCEGFWPSNISTFSVSSTSAFIVVYRDLYNNTLDSSSIPSVNISAIIMNESGLANFSIVNISKFSAYADIYFMSFSSGSMLLHVMVNEIEIAGSPYSFEMLPGLIDASHCKGSWSGGKSKFQAGTYPSFIAYLLDAFNNTVIPKFTLSDYLDFNAYAKTSGGDMVDLFNLTCMLDYEAGYERLQFLATNVGDFSFYVQYNATGIEGSPFPYSVIPGPISVEHCLGFLGDQSGSYMVSENITIYILLKDAYGNNITASTELGRYVNFSIGLNTTKNELHFPTDIQFSVQNDSGYEVITFRSYKAGEYFIYVINGNASIDNTLTVSINPGPISISNSQALWLNNSNIIRAGDQACAEVLFVDAYNNSVNSYMNFTLYFLQDGQSFDDASVLTRLRTGYQLINFVIIIPGDYSLHLVYDSHSELNGSPLEFTVIPAYVSPADCEGFWVDDNSTFQIGQQGVLKVILMDVFKNTISASSDDAKNLRFNAYIKNKVTSMNSNIRISASPDVDDIYESLTFYPITYGEFLLYVFINGMKISGSPFTFTVFTTTPHTSTSSMLYIPKCTGSWLNGTNAFRIGQQAMFKIFLKDDANNPLAYDSHWNFIMYVMDLRGKKTNMRPILLDPGPPGSVILAFNVTTKGSFLLRVGDASSQINRSPFLFSVLPGVAWSYFHP